MGKWMVCTGAVCPPQTLAIQTQVVTPSERTNTAAIIHADQFDPDHGNNSASVTEAPLQSALALAKTAANPPPHVRDTFGFLVALTNNGPRAPTSVTVSDALPGGLTC